MSIYSCGGFNTPTLCVVTKGIKADCNHLIEHTARNIEHCAPTLASELLIFSVRRRRCPYIFEKPEFYVFYNSVEDYPETTMLKLSDAFITKPERIPLELEVKVFNINKSKGAEVLSLCKPLEEYSLFVEEVRKQMQFDSENGFTNAVKICIEKGILKDYLMRKSREVINMLIAEYDYDTDIAVQRQESLMIGRQEGIQVGRQEGFADGLYQSKLETAKNLLAMNFPIENIVKATGLSMQEIEAL